MYQEFRKTATVKAKLFEKGDEDGMTTPDNFTMLDAMENDKYGCGQLVFSAIHFNFRKSKTSRRIWETLYLFRY